MKSIQFAIMVVLIFGVAASPVFSNAFADEIVCGVKDVLKGTECSEFAQKASAVAPEDRDAADRVAIGGLACNYGQASTVECPRNPSAS